MKNTFALVTLVITSLTLNAFAQEVATQEVSAEEQAQIDLVYKVSCSSQMELVTSPDVMAAIGANASLGNIRTEVQQFVVDPTAVISEKIKSYEDQIAEIIAAVEKEVPADQIAAAVQQYATENNMTVEEARPVFMVLNANMFIAQQNGGTPTSRESIIMQTSTGNCSLLSFIKEKVAASGCKNDAGDVLDLTKANNFCQAIAVPSAALGAASAQANAIQQEAQMAIQLLTQTIQKGAEAQLAPVLQSMEAPQTELLTIVEGLLSTATAAPVAP